MSFSFSQVLFLSIALLVCFTLASILDGQWCFVHASLCTSLFRNLHMLTYKFNRFPPPNATPSLHANRTQTCLNIKAAWADRLASMGVAPFLLLSNPHSGSTWASRVLDSNADISSRGELLYNPERACRVDERTNECSWKRIEELLNERFDPRYMTKKNPVAHGYKVQEEQIGFENAGQFADWCMCNNVRVLHFVRESALASFYSMQADVFDILQTGEAAPPGDDNGEWQQKSSTNRMKITLDAAMASAFVRRTEQATAAFRQTFQYHIPPIPYMQAFYESAANDESLAVWRSILGFLGAHVPAAGEEEQLLDTQAIRKVHRDGGCDTKIANWDEVRNALVGTESYYACAVGKK